MSGYFDISESCDYFFAMECCQRKVDPCWKEVGVPPLAPELESHGVQRPSAVTAAPTEMEEMHESEPDSEPIPETIQDQGQEDARPDG